MENVLNAFADPVAKALPKIPQAVMAFAVGLIVIHVMMWIIEKLLVVSRTPRALQNIISSITSVILWLILIAAILQSIGLGQIAIAFSGSIAILGVAIGAGANALVQDVIAGLFLARDRDFDVGMHIKTGDIEGIIRRIDIRKVRIEDDQGRYHVLPNSSLDKASWQVVDRDPEKESEKPPGPKGGSKFSKVAK